MNNKKLIDLDPVFVSSGGEGVTRNGKPVQERFGVGIRFNCPCGCKEKPCILFENPLDGGDSIEGNQPKWKRQGEDFRAMTLKPSILRKGVCGWHGHLVNGEFIEC